MEKDIETEDHSRKNVQRGKPNKWLWAILIIVVGIAIAFAVIRYNMSVATRLQQTEQENSQLQANQNQLQQENNQLYMNQLRQHCDGGCMSHTPLFSQSYWEYCSQTLGCRNFPTQQECVNSCVANP